jgi:hypothetical protein
MQHASLAQLFHQGGNKGPDSRKAQHIAHTTHQQAQYLVNLCNMASLLQPL